MKYKETFHHLTITKVDDAYEGRVYDKNQEYAYVRSTDFNTVWNEIYRYASLILEDENEQE